jgi:predicted transposase YdaD
MSYDSTLKYLLETFPQSFVRWLLNTEASPVELLPTELNVEPIRVDGLFFLQVDTCVLHLEFQTSPQSQPPLPLRMLDYGVRLYRLYDSDIEQVIIFLKPTNSPAVFETEFRTRNTTHRYRVIRIWECDRALFLNDPGLYPLATLAQNETPESLLQEVADKVNEIETPELQRNVSACVQLLAGLKFSDNLIGAYFREDIMRESVVYQRILQEGIEQSRDREKRFILRLLQRQIGTVSEEIQARLVTLSLEQMEALGEALLDFEAEADLIRWLGAL